MLEKEGKPTIARDVKSAVERIAELEKEREDDYGEASTYAMSLFNTYYKNKPDAVGFELCESVAAIITQIDNMATGVIAELEAALRWSRDSNTGHEPSLSVMQRYYDDLIPKAKALKEQGE